MHQIINPYRELQTDITDREFEYFCLETLKALGEQDELKDYLILSNQKVKTSDGIYQIDILFEYSAMHVKNKVLVECKKLKRAVERKVVAELYAKLNSIGANKGIVISTSGFQSGAVEYAKTHGITLIQCFDKYIKFIQNSINTLSWEQCQFMKMYPKYFFMEWDLELDYPMKQIYPNSRLEKEIEERIVKAEE